MFEIAEGAMLDSLTIARLILWRVDDMSNGDEDEDEDDKSCVKEVG